MVLITRQTKNTRVTTEKCASVTKGRVIEIKRLEKCEACLFDIASVILIAIDGKFILDFDMNKLT